MTKPARMARSWIITVTIILILAAEIFVADLVVPMGLAVWLPYAALVLISLWMPHRKHTINSAIAATALILLAGFLSPFSSAELGASNALLSRALGVLIIWMTALLCLQRKQVETTQKQTHEELEMLVQQRTADLLDKLAGDLSGEQREYLEIVLRNANQLQAMIEDLLEVTRVQTGKLSLEMQPTSVAELIDETVSSLRTLAGAKGIALSADVSAHLPPVHADPQRVTQILRNLSGTAAPFSLRCPSPRWRPSLPSSLPPNLRRTFHSP